VTRDDAAAEASPSVALLYENDAHLEPQWQGPATEPKPADGVFGRHVANSEFLGAWLDHGRWERLLALVANQASAASIRARFDAYSNERGAGRRLEIVPLSSFHERFFPKAPVDVLHLPQPMDAEFAWVRQHKRPHAFALSGVTHTISIKEVMQLFRESVTAPFEEYDTLFCISGAARSVVRAVADNYAEYLRERFGGSPRLRLRLEALPFGVDTQKFRPPTPTERLAARQLLGIPSDAICVLYVGRLSYASKVHPFPMYAAVAEAARRTGRKVHLLLAGWAESPSILKKFQQGAQALGAGITIALADGMHPRVRREAWHAADIFTSLSDNIQETLGLTVLEAQACGLPVITSDWDGCRESVSAGETALVVPTRMVRGATVDVTSRHLMSETSYGVFLGETNQTVSVDVPLATAAFARLFENGAERTRMGERGRARILEHYTWLRIIDQYQTVWGEQDRLRREHLGAGAAPSKVRTPVAFPDVEFAFAAYPTDIVEMDAEVIAAEHAAGSLASLLKLPLASYLASSRVADEAVLSRLLSRAASGCELAELDALLAAEGAEPQRARATLAWMLKYDLLRMK
jgi:glycosyltransferase involved in cell wall biosynthesis